MVARRRRHIDLALQGGCARGAFTWGVLDRLLEDERLEFDAASGTSAGALRLHRVDAERELAQLAAASKVNARWAFVSRLPKIGRDAAAWLERNFTHIGRRSTLQWDSYSL